MTQGTAATQANVVSVALIQQMSGLPGFDFFVAQNFLDQRLQLFNRLLGLSAH